MSTRSRGLFSFGLALATSLLATSGCGGECVDRRGVVVVPASRAADVSVITATGPACPGTPPVCTDANTPCTEYVVRGYAAGACHVTFEFTSGASPVSFDFQFESVDGSSCTGAGFFPVMGTERRTIPSA